MTNFSDPAQFGRVAVVMGGSSAEREVSLDSGRNVLAALKARGVDAHAIDGIPALLDALRAGHFARVFNILHGQHGGGEDGVLQGALESLERAVHRLGRARFGAVDGQGALQARVAVARLCRRRSSSRCHVAPTCTRRRAQVGFPLIVKPACEGSSVGVTRVFAESDLDEAVELAAHYPGDLLMETLIEGDELTVAHPRPRRCCPAIHIVPEGRVLRLQRQVRRRGHAVPLPRPRGRRRNGTARAVAAGVRCARLPRLGPRRRDA